MDNIIKTYEDNVTLEKQSTIKIDIRVDFNLIPNLTKTGIIDPETIYHQLYPKVVGLGNLIKTNDIQLNIPEIQIPELDIEIPNIEPDVEN